MEIKHNCEDFSVFFLKRIGNKAEEKGKWKKIKTFWS